MVRQHLTPPPSSTRVEKLFSYGGLVATNHRSSLSGEKLGPDSLFARKRTDGKLRSWLAIKKHSFVFELQRQSMCDKNIAKGTTDPRVEFILPKKLLEVISEVQT